MSPTRRLPRSVAEVIGRIRAIDHARPELDSERAANVLGARLRAVGCEGPWLDPPAIHWAADPGDAERRLSTAAARRSNADWYGRERSLYRTIHEALRDAPEETRRTWQTINRAVVGAREAVAHLAVYGLTVTPGVAAHLYYVWWGVRLAAQLRGCFAVDDDRVAEARRSLEPMLALWETGVWAFAVGADEVVAVPAPALSIRRGRLHREDGPAVLWASGRGRYFLSGIEVPEVVVLAPSKMTIEMIVDEANLEARRIMLERFGYERFVEESGGVAVQEDEFGTLYRIPIVGDDPLVLVEVVNATPERDGSFRKYMLRVPPSVTTARAAVAWTFGMTEAEYAPILAT